MEASCGHCRYAVFTMCDLAPSCRNNCPSFLSFIATVDKHRQHCNQSGLPPLRGPAVSVATQTNLSLLPQRHQFRFCNIVNATPPPQKPCRAVVARGSNRAHTRGPHTKAINDPRRIAKNVHPTCATGSLTLTPHITTQAKTPHKESNPTKSACQ